MPIKKKERALTPEEMKEKQKREYASFWFNSETMFGSNLYPVSDAFSQQVTLLFLCDPADYAVERVCEVLEKWKLQYSKLPWDSVIVFQQKYPFMKNPKFFERLKHHKIFIDPFGELFERFGSQKEPVAVILKNGTLISSIPLLPRLSDMIFDLETQFQKALRIEDAGLPLPSIEKASFLSSSNQQSVGPDGVSTFGEWNGSKTFILTESNQSFLTFGFKGKGLRVVAMAHPNSRENIKVSVSLNEKPLPIGLHSSIVHHDKTGNAIFEINKTTGIYEIFSSDHEITGVIKLIFLNAFDNSAIFYELKIGL